MLARYFYDGEGKRVKKKVYNPTGTVKEETVFVYDGLGKLIAEYSTAIPPPNPTTSYTATDMLGSPRVITNSQGEVVSRRDFMPFGEELANDPNYRTAALKYNTGDEIRQKFTGYQKDEETNLDFAEARMYENRHARFTAVDPLLASGKSANPQTFNRYVYVMNNPTFLTDPSGLCPPVDENPCQVGDIWENPLGAGVNFTWDGEGWFNPIEVPGDPINDNSTNESVQRLLGGFDRGLDDVKSGTKKGVENVGIDIYNKAVDILWEPTPLYYLFDKPTIQRNTYNSIREAKYGTAVETTGITAPIIVGGVTAGGSQTSLNLVSRPNGVVVTEQGLNQVKSHLSQFDEWKPNTDMINRLENAMQNGQRVSGADRNFYFHELKEGTLMNRRGLIYEIAHPKALKWDNVTNFDLYHPDVIRANPTRFNDFWRSYWNINGNQ